MRSARRRSRELALQALYAWQLSGASFEDLFAQLCESPGFDKADESYLRTLLSGVTREAQAIRPVLEQQLDRPWQELSPVERGILLMAGYELKFSPEIPYRVVINEAVEVAKVYGGTDGHKYVNGVLDRAARTFRPDEASK
ncbi:MAG: N utilization substance protein B [Betaproteobacteria bacterium RIFCSPLOWO2_12_FULL_66_14]|nr:MAG: N utilization substance protein B [Betaproteobacteria bacterium RIFCSPLOWO2_12_FULL_66_14]